MDTVLPHTTPKTIPVTTRNVDENIGEPIRANMGRNVESDNSDNYTPPTEGRRTLAQFLELAKELRTRAKGQRKRGKVQRFRSKSRLASERSDREAVRTSREGEGPPTLRKVLRKGRQMYAQLTDPAGRDVHGLSVVSSRLSPLPFTKRTMIGAAMCLERELKEGKALSFECPASTQTADGPNGTSAASGQAEQENLDEHLNLMTCYKLELLSKLMRAEENRAQMRSYINFEQNAEGDENLGEYEP
jgi:hypothetical protein